jgi:hypothetical protein
MILWYGNPVHLSDSLVGAAVGSAIAVGGATVAIVTFSVSRQEHLSSRTRELAKEFRDADTRFRADHPVDKEAAATADARRLNLATQCVLFEERLQRCVCGHIFLYFALIIATCVSWGTLIWSLGSGGE